MNEKIDFETAVYGEKKENSKIKVIGVGGGGGNAVKHMYEDGIKGVHFMICNTDRQALEENQVPFKLVLGESGLGAGANPEVARKLAEESREKIIDFIGENTDMLFITAGMGKGTGTGAAPVIAEIAREMGILTIAVVTYPFKFEGKKREEQADEGIKRLKQFVDSLIVVKNQNIIKYYKDETLDAAFGYADDVLKNAVKCIAELITVCAKQNIDYKDIESVMRNSGAAMLGLASASGENRVDDVIEEVFNCPLLEQDLIVNAKNFLFFISYGPDKPFGVTELTELTQKFDAYKSEDAAVIWGNALDESLGSNIKLAVIATNYNTIEERNIKPFPVDATNKEQIMVEEKLEDVTLIDTSNTFDISDLKNITFGNVPVVEKELDPIFVYPEPLINIKKIDIEESDIPVLTTNFAQQNVVSSFNDNKFENDENFKQYTEVPAIHQLQQQNTEIKVAEVHTPNNLMEFDDSGNILYGVFPD